MVYRANMHYGCEYAFNTVNWGAGVVEAGEGTTREPCGDGTVLRPDRGGDTRIRVGGTVA